MSVTYVEGLSADHPNYNNGNIQRVEGKAARVNNEFKPSSYTGKVTTDATGVTTAIASGATKILLQSLETTDITEFAVMAFGTSAADAISNLTIAASVGTTGIVIRSGDATAGMQAPDHIIGVPEDATHFALVNGLSAQAQIIMVTQGI